MKGVMKTPGLFYGLLITGIILLAIGAYGVWTKFSGTITSSIWGTMVATYVFFALASTGSSIVNSIHTIYGYNGAFKKVIRYTVAISLLTVLPAFPVIISDLTQPQAFQWMFLSFNPTSRIAWMGVLYILFVLVLLIELIYEINKGKTPLWLAISVLIISVLTHVNLGQIFGSAYGVPLWFGPFAGLYFITSAVLIGFALQVVGLSISERIRHGRVRDEVRDLLFRVHSKGMLTVLPIFVFLMMWLFIVSWYSPEMWKGAYEVLYGKLAVEFWSIEIGLGVVLAIILLSMAHVKRRLSLLLITALILMFAQFMGKVTYISAGQIGQITSQLAVFDIHGHVADEIVSEVFSFTELSSILLAFGLWLILISLGVYLLALEEEDKPFLWIFRKLKNKAKQK